MADAPDALTPDERAELERLRRDQAELIRLRREVRLQRDAGGRTGRAWRWAGAIALLVVAALLFMLVPLALFVRTQLLDTDRYVATVSPLARDPAIQDAIADRLTTAIVTQVDLKSLAQQLADALTERGAPQAINGLVGPAVSGLTGFIHTQIRDVVASEEFARVWDSANRVAHDELDALLTTGRGTFLVAEGTVVSLDLGAVLDLVKQKLVDAGFTIAANLPQVSTTLPLFQSEQLPKIRTYVSWLNTAAWLLPLLCLVLLVAGILVAPNRRRGLLIGASLLAVTMLVLLGALSAARTYYLNNLPATVSPEAARVLLDTELRFLVKGIQTLVVVFVIVALLSWLSGPSAPAVAIRRLINAGLDGIAGILTRTGVSFGPVPEWARRHRRSVGVGVVVVAVAILVIWGQPGAAGVLWVTAGALVALGLVEVVSMIRPHAVQR